MQNKLVVLRNEDVVCLLCGRKLSFKYYIGPGKLLKKSKISRCMWLAHLFDFYIKLCTQESETIQKYRN